MKLLAIETATEGCSVALWLDGEIIERFEIAPRRHAELMLPWVGDLLAQAGITRSQLDAIACGCGPGAFTGVRLAVAATQGLGLALDRPVISVSTLHALALPAIRLAQESRQGDCGVLAAIDARMGEVYVARYVPDASGVFQPSGEEQVIAPEAVSWPDISAIYGVGTGFSAVNDTLSRRFASQLVNVDPLALPRAADIARVAADKFALGDVLAPEDLQPAYLRNNVAQTLVEQGKSQPMSPF